MARPQGGRAILAVDRIRHLPHAWECVHELLAGDPSAWLPEPLWMTGVHIFKGRMQILGVPVRFRYELFDPWRDGDTAFRKTRIQPRYPGAVPALVCNVLIRPEREDITQVRFQGRREPPAFVLARPLAPLLGWAIGTAFADQVIDRFDRHICSEPDTPGS